MSSNERRKKVDREKAVRSQPQRRTNLPRSNITNTVARSQRRIRNIKSPFATDQTKTIGNRPNQTKKRVVGQIPLRDRQHKQLKANQKQSSGIQVRKLPQQRVQQQKKQIKKVQKQVRKPSQFNRKNKTRSDVEQVFDFNTNRSFF